MTDSVVVVQARTDSRRLPGKVLQPVAGREMVLHVLERALDIGVPVILATSRDASDDQLAGLVSAHGYAVHRGQTDDVLGRFVGAVPEAVRYVIRITADCPLLDPVWGRSILGLLRMTTADYATNTLPPSFPDGLDVEGFTRDALRIAAEESTTASDREHVTPFLRRSMRMRKVNLAHVPDLSAQRWTVDDGRDLAFVRAVYDRLQDVPSDRRSSMYTVLGILEREPELLDLNAGTARNEGYRRSLAEERA